MSETDELVIRFTGKILLGYRENLNKRTEKYLCLDIAPKAKMTFKSLTAVEEGSRVIKLTELLRLLRVYKVSFVDFARDLQNAIG